jgi:hypothetical protein
MRHWDTATRQREHDNVVATFEMSQPRGQLITCVTAVAEWLPMVDIQSQLPSSARMMRASKVPHDGTLVA